MDLMDSMDGMDPDGEALHLMRDVGEIRLQVQRPPLSLLLTPFSVSSSPPLLLYSSPPLIPPTHRSILASVDARPSIASVSKIGGETVPPETAIRSGCATLPMLPT